MKYKFLSLCALLGSVGALQASNTLLLNGVSGDPTLSFNSTNYYVSPFTGTLGSSATNPLTSNPAVELFCDDFNDSSTAGTNWTVNITTVSNAGLANSDVRFATASGGAGSYNSTFDNSTTYPTATTLYEQMAWLFTQTSALSMTQGDKDDIQEAVWEMTGNQSGNGTPTATQSGATKSVAQWIALAQTYYNASAAADSAAGYLDPNYNLWYAVTDTANTTNKSQGTGNQEFLAYYGGTNSAPLAAVPEPATFGLFGSALLFGAMFARRRKLSPVEKA